MIHRLPMRLAALCLLAALPRAAVSQPIAPLHCNDSTGVTRAKDQLVTVTGIVTAQFSSDRLTRMYVQDSTGGVCVYGSPAHCAAPGDSVRVSGKVTSFNGLTEVAGTTEAPIAIVALGRGTRPVAALAVTLERIKAAQQADGCEPDESRLVLVRNCLVRSATGDPLPAGAKFTEGTNYRLVHAGADSASHWAMLRVVTPSACDSSRTLAGRPIPARSSMVMGILSQYLGRSATSGGYQLLPRDMEDVRPETADPVLPASDRKR